jgi:hypothetical protein
MTAKGEKRLWKSAQYNAKGDIICENIFTGNEEYCNRMKYDDKHRCILDSSFSIDDNQGTAATDRFPKLTLVEKWTFDAKTDSLIKYEELEPFSEALEAIDVSTNEEDNDSIKWKKVWDEVFKNNLPAYQKRFPGVKFYWRFYSEDGRIYPDQALIETKVLIPQCITLYERNSVAYCVQEKIKPQNENSWVSKSYEYNQLNQLTKLDVFPNPSLDNNSSQITYRYSYNEAGQMIMSRQQGPMHDVTTDYEYDRNGNQTSATTRYQRRVITKLTYY